MRKTTKESIVRFLPAMVCWIVLILLGAVLVGAFSNEASMIYDNDPERPLEQWRSAAGMDKVPHYCGWDKQSRCWRWVFMQREIGTVVFAVDENGKLVNGEKQKDVNTYSGPMRADEISDKVEEGYSIKQVIRFRDGNYGILRGTNDFPTWSIYTPAAAKKMCEKYGIDVKIKE